MRVAIFTDNDFGKVNGVTTALRAVIAHQPDDVQARVYTSAAEPAYRSDYLSLPSPGIGIPFYSEMRMHWPRFRAFLQHARHDGIDVVHYTTPGPVGLAAQYVAWSLRVPMVGSFHTQLAEYTALLSGSRHLGRLMREYLRWPYGRCRVVLVPSEATRASLVEGRIAPGKHVIWPRGVDASLFTPQRRSAALRESWGVSEADCVVLYVGRLSKEKGLEAIPSLAAAMKTSGIRHRFVFVGDGPLRPWLSGSCRDAVFTGSLTHDAVASAMASSDVFLFPSRTDTAGNVVLEAQAAGLPVVVTSDGGPREQMQNGVTGFVATAGAPDELSTATLELAGRPELRGRMSEQARQFALSRDWPRALAPLYQAWRDVCALPTGERPHHGRPLSTRLSAS